MTARLEIADLKVRFDTDEGQVLAVNGVSFSVAPGEVVALVGESGCGKSMTAMATMGLLPATATATGSVRLEGRELSGLPAKQMRAVRGREISMIFQEPMTSLNPVFTVGYQISEVLRRHERLSRAEARRRAVELLDLVRIPAPEQRIDEYPHQMSGGMRQRVMIAMAVACNPKVLLADEPSTALDVTIQAQILDIMRDLRQRLGTSIVMITHDLGVVADIADRVVVMYAGHVVETGTVDQLFAAPQHPYTVGLLGSVPRPDLALADAQTRLAEIPGIVPTLRGEPDACVFAPRCPRADEPCLTRMPPLTELGDGQEAACVHPGPASTPSPEVVNQ
ncbi:MAG TPA: ABC transporter ATP-binding protein [Nocardioidaceae bacterium]|jgi:peptide/nickel transport system ATP-binding protein|nr:ABC transporter ATP-binding protein [Nocardioidaceae bacterium]